MALQNPLRRHAGRPDLPPPGRPVGRSLRRRHRASLRQLDRDLLERSGWRTTLDFRENHVRSESGELLEIESVWVAEAEHVGSHGVIGAHGRSESRVWAELAAAARIRSDAAPGVRLKR
ncbi:MAG: hypothetical protein HKN44_08265 [Ilumatobacter sp.]|nr:hypothetical protein [Ilumatobacter sp.]